MKWILAALIALCSLPSLAAGSLADDPYCDVLSRMVGNVVAHRNWGHSPKDAYAGTRQYAVRFPDKMRASVVNQIYFEGAFAGVGADLAAAAALDRCEKEQSHPDEWRPVVPN